MKLVKSKWVIRGRIDLRWTYLGRGDFTRVDKKKEKKRKKGLKPLAFKK